MLQRALLRTAQEIAKGMDYIHSFGIIHGDLKLGNVLLKTHRVDRRGYVAKVSDFGMSVCHMPTCAMSVRLCLRKMVECTTSEALLSLDRRTSLHTG